MAATLSSGGHPNSNMPGRRKEDDVNLVAFDWQAGDDSSFNDDGRGRKYIARAGDYAGALSTSRRDAIAGPSVGVRRLTPRECERLQGFPDDWTLIDWKGKPSPDSRRYAALGNAVTVQVAEWIAHRIVAADAASYGPGADTSEGAA